MILVTGGAGFIGANLIKSLNKKNNSNIIIVDNIRKVKKNIKLLRYKDFFDKDNFIELLNKKKFNCKVSLIVHLGACSDTTETNWEYLKYNNIHYTKKLYEYSKSVNSKFIYASSASVYGKESGYIDKKINSYRPLNLYGKSKLEIDKFFFQNKQKKVIGLRFFNVYGSFENHKKKMSSPVTKFTEDLIKKKYCNIFKFEPRYEPYRDFIHVNDTVKIIEYLSKNKEKGLYNVGTGFPNSFIEVARIIIKHLGYGKIRFIQFPNHLKNRYQFFTKANINKLRRNGFNNRMLNLNHGIKIYLKQSKFL